MLTDGPKRVFNATTGLVWLGLCLALATGVLAAQEPERLFSKGPYIQAVSPSWVSILWESLTNQPGIVHFGQGDKLDRQVEGVTPQMLKSYANTAESGPTAASRLRVFYLYEAPLQGLEPGKSYSYSVEVDGRRSPVRQFRTLDPAAAEVRFIAYGDTRSDPRIHGVLARRFGEHNPALILHTGDLVARGEDYDLWSKEFFKPLAEVIDRVPFFSVIGNHEHDGTNYLRYFHLPGKELWYSLDVGPVHILALDFRAAASKAEQFSFARQDLLASRAPWKIVVLHTPFFNIAGHASAWGHTNYLPLLYEAKVDLVLAGHSHMYERFRPVAPKAAARAWAVQHVTTGGGGANLHPSLPHPALVKNESTNHYMVFEVSRERLQAEVYRADGSLMDRFELKKPGGRQEAEYLAQVYPEESLKLFAELGPSLAGRTATLPTADTPAEVQLAVLPRKHNATPAELEISLMPESARDYELVDGPLHCLTPAAGQTNLVWVKVRARAGSKIGENKSRELTPALIFAAKVTAPEGEAVAYGARGRVSKSLTVKREAGN